VQRTFNDKVEFLMSSDGVDALLRLQNLSDSGQW
jgi:hypothetical protein